MEIHSNHSVPWKPLEVELNDSGCVRCCFRVRPSAGCDWIEWSIGSASLRESAVCICRIHWKRLRCFLHFLHFVLLCHVPIIVCYLGLCSSQPKVEIYIKIWELQHCIAFSGARLQRRCQLISSTFTTLLCPAMLSWQHMKCKLGFRENMKIGNTEAG